MSQKILARKGLRKDLSQLNIGEFGYCVDTKELFIGFSSTENKLINSVSKQSLAPDTSLNNEHIKIDKNGIFISEETDLNELVRKLGGPSTTNQLLTAPELIKILSGTNSTKISDKRLIIENFIVAEDNASTPTSINLTNESLTPDMDMANSNNFGIYVIELKRWGIVQGSFGKPPYSVEQWKKAYNNILGFNQALKYASDNGMNTAIVPNGTYSFCYTNLNGAAEIYAMVNTPIKLYNNQTLDLNGSTFEVIYDSINKNPYDKSPVTTPAWKLSGELIRIDNVINAKVINGTIVGDIPNRSFSDGGNGFNSEKGMEQTYGIKIDSGAQFISIENIDVSMFMGDGITIGSYPTKTGKWNLNPSDTKAFPGYVDATGKIVQTLTGAYVTNKFPVIQGEHKQLQMRTSGGYTRIPLITNKTFEYIFYNSNDAVIARKKAVYLQVVTVPLDTFYIRLQFINEKIGVPSLDILFSITKPQAHHVKITGCTVHDNHRGGISGGADFTYIAYNKVYHNGMDSGLNIPLFTDSTRYAINFEDSYSNYVIIENNHIFSGVNGVLMGVYHGRISGNIISEIGGVVVYNNANMIIDGNVFYESSGLQITNSVATQERNILFSNNTINASSMTVVATGVKTRVRLINNVINIDSLSSSGNVEFIGNNIKSYTGSTYAGYSNVTIDNIKRCTGNTFEDFNYGSHYRVSVMKPRDSTNDISNNVFKSVSFNSNNLANDIEFLNSAFYDCLVTGQVADAALSHSMLFDHCFFQDSSLELGGKYVNNTSIGGVTGKASFNNCKINYTSKYTGAYLMGISDNIKSTGYPENIFPRNYVLELINSELIHKSTSSITLIKYYNQDSNFDINHYKKVMMENSRIRALDISKLKLFLSTNPNIYTNSATIKNTTYEGFNGFPTPTYGSLESYNPVYVSTSSTVPSSGFFALGQKVENTNVVAGGFLGWICVKAGYANTNPWAANKAYSVNTFVHSNNKVYKATTTGISGNAAPAHSAGKSLDGGVTWEYVSGLAEFKTYGVISN
ncbi:right-handed parallel beta-helix repeat-containing protein [Peribacillus muralis]|uniref:right-handed parallel beta-helix repeat-containing protein n=1 Tax=Peribacillus muralis TaxID=264697 RepID=UPI003D084406